MAKVLYAATMFVAPVMLGDGVRVFDHPGGAQVRLEQLPGMAEYWYRVAALQNV